MRSTILLRTAVAASGLAAALSLSACDGITINFGEDGQRQTQETQQPDDTRTDDTRTDESGTETGTTTDESGTDAGAGTDTGTSGGSDTGTGTGTGSDSGTGTDTSGGGDTSTQQTDFTIDENGTGTIPEALLEEDITQAYEDQGTAIDSVDCSGDMRIYDNQGSQMCDVVANGEEYYGIAKVTDIIGQNVYYELEFAGIDF